MIVAAVASKISNVVFGYSLVVWVCPVGNVSFGVWISVANTNDEKTKDLQDVNSTEPPPGVVHIPG